MPTAQERAEDAANAEAIRVLHNLECGRITDIQVLRVLRMLFKSQPMQQRFRANPPGKRGVVGGLLGATRPLGRAVASLKVQGFAWGRTREVAKLLNRWRDQKLSIHSDRDDEVRPTSIQINLNFCGAVHVDGNNLGPSHIGTVGSFEQGALLVEDSSGSVLRELVSKCGGSGSSSSCRTPGMYRFKRVNIQTEIKCFNGATHLHCAEECTGERFSMVWFSMNAHWLAKLCPADVAELRASGYRPRSKAELDAMPHVADVLPKNDAQKYPDGFLYFARSQRSSLEAAAGCSRIATDILWTRWRELADKPEAMKNIEDNDVEVKSTRQYWAGLERLERLPKRSKTENLNTQAIPFARRPVASPLGQRLEPPNCHAAASNDKDDVLVVEGDQDETDDAINLLDSDVEAAGDMEAFAEHVLEEFPGALNDTEAGFSLLIQVLTEFGFDSLEQRSQALNFVQSKRQERRDAAFALRLQRRQQLGRPASFNDDTQSSLISIEDSPPVDADENDTPAAKRSRAASSSASNQVLATTPSELAAVGFHNLFQKSSASSSACHESACHQGRSEEDPHEIAPSGHLADATAKDAQHIVIDEERGRVVSATFTREQALKVFMDFLRKKGQPAAQTMAQRVAHGNGVVLQGQFFSPDVMSEALQLWQGIGTGLDSVTTASAPVMGNAHTMLVESGLASTAGEAARAIQEANGNVEQAVQTLLSGK